MSSNCVLQLSGLFPAFVAVLVACRGGPADVPTPVLATLSVSITSDTLLVGGAARSIAEGRDQSGAAMRIPDPTWTSSDASVATVTYVGYVTAVGLGTATILAAALGKSAGVAVHVVPIPVAGVLLGPSDAVLSPNETVRFAATPIDAAGRALPGRAIAWLSSDTSVVHVSEDGLVTAAAPGVTSVSAISETAYASARVRVSGPAGPVAKVTINPAAASLAIGQTRQLGITLEDAEGDLATDRSVTWTSSAPNVASVSTNGLVQAVATGSAVIEALSEGVRGTAAIVVVDPADAVTIRVAEPVVNEIVGDTLRIVATTSARNPIAHVHAKAFNRETDLTLQPIAQGRAIAWVGTVYLTDVHYGPYELVITAVDTKGNQGIVTIAFTRGAREGNGGARLPPRNK